MKRPKETSEEKRARCTQAYRELNWIIVNNDRDKLVSWMRTHENHALAVLPEDDQLFIGFEKLYNSPLGEKNWQEKTRR